MRKEYRIARRGFEIRHVAADSRIAKALLTPGEIVHRAMGRSLDRVTSELVVGVRPGYAAEAARNIRTPLRFKNPACHGCHAEPLTTGIVIQQSDLATAQP